MFEKIAQVSALTKVLAPAKSYQPYPTLADRPAWQRLPRSLRQALVTEAEKHICKPWPALPASLYLGFARNGNRKEYERPYFERRRRLLSLALAECCEARGRFLDAIADGIWAICEESSWCLPAHVGCQKAGVGLPDVADPILDLFAAETGGLLAWLLYLIQRLDSVSLLLRPRLRMEIDHRVLTPFLHRSDFWWMGLRGQRVNNWNPWIISNVIFCALHAEPNQCRRIKILAKAMRCLDKFVRHYPADGGCDEGPGYWGRAGASLFECLEALYGYSRGAIDFYRQPLIREIGRFIYRVHIADRWFVNFADASAIMLPEGGLVYRFGKRIGDRAMQDFGRWCSQQRTEILAGHIVSPHRALMSLFSWQEMQKKAAKPPMPRDVWMPKVEVALMRSQAGACRGLMVAAKGGHNAESHNHNDVGNFIVYAEGRPVLIDIGVETYTRKTFSRERYEIWTMQSQYHNLPTINDVMQQNGRQFCATDAVFSTSKHTSIFELNIASAYPPASGLKSWRRRLTLRRPSDLLIEDSYECLKPPRHLFLSLITPCAPRCRRDSINLARRRLPGNQHTGTACIAFARDALSIKCEILPVADAQLAAVWGDCLWRLIFTPRRRVAKGEIVLRLRA